MEVSTITTNTNITPSTVPLPQATASVTITTTTIHSNNNNNTSQLLSNDNLQSQTQKSPLTNTSQASVKSPIRSNNNPSNNDKCHNMNESEIFTPSNHCYEANNHDVNMITVTNALPTETNCQNSNQDHAVAGCDQLSTDIKYVIDALLSRVEPEYIPITTATTSQSLLLGPNDDSFTTTALIMPVVDEDINRTKDIVTLRNLEITPPPQPVEILKDEQTISTPEPPNFTSKTKSGQKRKSGTAHPEASEKSEESSVSRSKRIRTQTKLFQVGEEETTSRSKHQTSFQSEKASSTRKKPSSSRKNSAKTPTIQHRQQPTHYQPQAQQKQISQDPQDVIHYEKNDYLAIRNEDNLFYLCQLTESVRVSKSHVKIKWLDTKDDKTYFVTSHYDKIPRESIIVPVDLKKIKSEKKGPQLFTLDEQMRDLIMDRLRRSLNVPPPEGE